MTGKKTAKEITAVYAGSFDPVTNGHVDIVKRALEVFDKIIIAIGTNSDKNPLFTIEERRKIIIQATKGMNVEVDTFSCLLIDYVRSKGCKFIIRGLRAVSDFDYEFQLSVMNRKLAPEIESVFLMTDNRYFFLSSSMVKEVALLGGKVDCHVPPVVLKALTQKLKERQDEKS